MYIPKEMFLTKGKGVAKEKLTSFEMALREAQIAHLNLVRVSSILPPDCEIVPLRRYRELYEEGVMAVLKPGAICHVVLSQCETNEPNRLIAASIGVARPGVGIQHGYLSEHHAFGQKAKVAGEFAEDLAATMLATTLGIEFDPDKDYDERKEIYRMSGKNVHSREITQTAEGNKDGLWTTVVAAAVLLP
jgi:arginine decarboxylase